MRNWPNEATDHYIRTVHYAACPTDFVLVAVDAVV